MVCMSDFLEVTKRFPNAKITVTNDSGPLFSDAQAFPSVLCNEVLPSFSVCRCQAIYEVVAENLT
jgi:hypothetical protein